MSQNDEREASRTIYELPADERAAAEAAFIAAHRGAPPEMHIASDRAWIEGFAHARAALANQRAEVPQSGQSESMRDRLQKQCSAWGAYWRASDSHGVELTMPQAVELLQDALGVEVEIKHNGCTTCDGIGMIGGPSYYSPDEGGVPCPDCSTPPSPPAEQPRQMVALTDEQIAQEWFYIYDLNLPGAEKARLLARAIERAHGIAPGGKE